MKLRVLCLSVLTICIAGIFNFANAQLVPVYVSQAVGKAALPPDAKGKWVIRGIVNLYKPNGEKLVAEGLMSVEGGILTGDFALKVVDGGYIRGNTVRIHMTLSEPFKIGLRHDVDGKAWVGDTMKFAKFKNIPNAPYTSGNVTWDGVETPVSIFLGYEQALTGNPGIRKPPPKPSAPIGARYQVTGRVVIANAEDGVGDNTCEISGYVFLRQLRDANGVKVDKSNGKILFQIIPQDVIKGMVFNFSNNLFFDVYDDDKSQYNLGGGFVDNDSNSADDAMWPDTANAMRWDFRRMAGKGEHNYPGDRDSESVEVYITVTKVSDLYKKP